MYEPIEFPPESERRPREVPRCACPEATLYREALMAVVESAARLEQYDPYAVRCRPLADIARAALSRVQSAESAERGERP